MNNQTQVSEEAKYLPIKVTVDKDINKVKVDSLIGKGMYLFALKHLLTKTVRVLAKHQWHVIRAVDNVSFPTSDDPVICLNYNSDTPVSGHLLKGGFMNEAR